MAKEDHMIKNRFSESNGNAGRGLLWLRARSLTFTLCVAAATLSTGAFGQEGTILSAYYINANTTGVPDARMSVVNPGSVNGYSMAGDLCVNIYVFLPGQQLSECCSCKVTPDGLLNLSLNNNLTNNPYAAVPAPSGSIKIVSSAVPTTVSGITFNGNCTGTVKAGAVTLTYPAAAVSYTPSGTLGAWITHVNVVGTGVYSVSETNFLNTTEAANEVPKLQELCYYIVSSFSGQGTCTCGSPAP
jgi:hypothetical protein